MTAPFFESRREAENLIVLTTHGSLDAVAMEVALDMLVKEVDGMDHGDMLIHAKGVEWPSLGAIGVELRHWVQLMAMVKKIDRVALMTDDGWLRALAAAESALIPNLVIKAFGTEDEASARAWLGETRTG